MITAFIQAKIVPMLMGSPGLGKSSVVQQIANKYNLKLVDMRLSQCDPCDLLGFPTVNGNKSSYIPMDTFPIEGDPIPDGYSGWLLFLDEFNSASPAVQAAGYRVILDRQIGQFNLHSKVAIVCAGNKEDDGAIVNPMSTAMQSRLAHLELAIDSKSWIQWASESGVDHKITDYINWKPGNLYTFRPNHTDKTYACPRTWEFASHLLKVVDIDSPDLLPMLAGVLSEGVAREFLGFTKIYKELPKPQEIEANPDSVRMPSEPSILFALSGTISHNATTENFSKLMRFVKRMPVEFQVVTLKDTVRRNKAMLAHPATRTWIAESSMSLF